MRAMANEQNTLTVILADHGNTYTRYSSELLEGRFEMFHPSLFIIVPDRVAALLGRKAMSALGENQRRLVTMIELHHSLLVLVNPLSGNVKLKGLFSPIAMNRTCDALELRLPNLCVCEGWDVPANNETSIDSPIDAPIEPPENWYQAEVILFTQDGNSRNEAPPKDYLLEFPENWLQLTDP